MRYLLTVILAALLLQGCYTKQVRHLAADAALIRPGVSTTADVERLLGTPDGKRSVAAGVEEYVYKEQQSDTLRKTPLVGSWVGTEGYEMIVVTMKDALVSSCEFRTFSENDQDWMDDYTWEDLK